MHPEDKRYTNLIGKTLVHPFREESDKNYLIPVIADVYVDPKLGTGAVKITPGHDQNDFEVGKRHQLPILNIMSENGSIQLESGPSIAWSQMASRLNDKPRFHARWDIIKDLESLELFRSKENHPMQIPVCSRSGDVVEPLLKPQWFLKTLEMAADALEASEKGSLNFTPKYYDKIWHNWLKENKDWCLSRQLWWGHRIPIWRCKTKQSKKEVFICAINEDEAYSKASEYLTSEKIDEKPILEQDEDVLDTWFSSALLPLSNFGWPNATADEEKYYPLSLMETGYDILFFWVARMVMLGQGKY